jgi:hypothetical protein
MIRLKPLPTNLHVKTKRPSWRSRAKLSTLLAIEIETAARRLQECINNGDWTGLEDSVRFIELQISFVKEVNSIIASTRRASVGRKRSARSKSRSKNGAAS